MPAAVTADNVWKRFRLYHERNQSLKAAVMRGRRAVADEFWALEGVSLEVPQGTTFGLIGENGSGKSTFLKCLARILRPERGEIKVEGKVSALLELGAGFHPELSGRENVFLNGAILGLSKKELNARFDEIVDFAGIAQFIDQPVKNYSSGMYVRLGFSVAINVDPDVLFVDEVLAVGDESFQRKCNEKFADLRDRGKTIILVSHSMGSVQNICHEVAWFDHGKVKMIGPPAKVIEEYTGSVHVERSSTAETPEEAKNRWGSGEGRIDTVTLFGEDGRQTTSFRPGDPCTIRIDYSTENGVKNPLFAIAVTTLEGMVVTGPTTRGIEMPPAFEPGKGSICWHIPQLPLLPGTYDVTVGFNEASGLREYDVRRHVARFDVERTTVSEFAGFVTFNGDWQLEVRR